MSSVTQESRQEEKTRTAVPTIKEFKENIETTKSNIDKAKEKLKPLGELKELETPKIPELKAPKLDKKTKKKKEKPKKKPEEKEVKKKEPLTPETIGKKLQKYDSLNIVITSMMACYQTSKILKANGKDETEVDNLYAQTIATMLKMNGYVSASAGSGHSMLKDINNVEVKIEDPSKNKDVMEALMKYGRNLIHNIKDINNNSFQEDAKQAMADLEDEETKGVLIETIKELYVKVGKEGKLKSLSGLEAIISSNIMRISQQLAKQLGPQFQEPDFDETLKELKKDKYGSQFFELMNQYMPKGDEK